MNLFKLTRTKKVKTFTLLNIYEVSFNEYEAVLRWGTIDGTSLNGSSLRYPIGNKVAVEYYVGHFKGFYGITSKMVADQVMTTGTGTGAGKGQAVQRQGSISSSVGGQSLESDDRISVVTSSSLGGNGDQDSSAPPPTIERRPSSVKLKVKPLKK